MNYNSELCLNEQVVDELVCPITMELPIDPVMAEDGRIYERAAIQEFFNVSRTGRFRSPMTNAEIGSKLYPAIQTKNIIKMIIKSGVVKDKSKMGKWNEQIKNENILARMRLKAAGGNLAAIENLGRWYSKGEGGLEKDHAQAYRWFNKAAEGGHVTSMLKVGYQLYFGIGVEAEEVAGLRLIKSAAEKGSHNAACLLGIAYLNGELGFTKDIIEAKKWLTQAVGSNCDKEAKVGLQQIQSKEMLLCDDKKNTFDDHQSQRKMKKSIRTKLTARAQRVHKKCISRVSFRLSRT